jgi:hypothetical protein
VLEPLDRVGDDPAAVFAERPVRPQLVQQLSDVIDRERGDRPPPERR